MSFLYIKVSILNARVQKCLFNVSVVVVTTLKGFWEL